MSDVCYSKNSLTNKLKQGTVRQQFKILIVDDDVNIAETFGEILKDRGHIVTVVNESVSCINKCQNYNYDIIFMDFHLDDIDGAEITDLLKSVCSNFSIIFAISGDDSNTAIKKFKEVGMDGALIKPLDIDVINKLMNSLEIRGGEIDKRVVKAMGNTTGIKMKKHLIVFE